MVEDGIAAGNVIPDDFAPTPEGLEQVRRNILKAGIVGRLTRRDEMSSSDWILLVVDADGRRLDDTLWPWNGVTGFPRPDFAPGGPMADSPTVSAPGQTPTIADMIDYQGRTSSPAQLGYGYDTVPYEPE